MSATLEDRRAKSDADLDAKCVRAWKRHRSLSKAARALGVKPARVRLAIERAGLDEPAPQAAPEPDGQAYHWAGVAEAAGTKAEAGPPDCWAGFVAPAPKPRRDREPPPLGRDLDGDPIDAEEVWG